MSKNTLYIGLVVIIVAALGAYFLATKGTQPSPNITTETLPTPPPLATKTPDQIKVIENVKDFNVSIKDMTFTPTEIKIKVNDQVFWTNNDSVAHKIKGESWGSVKINPGEKFVQVFDKAGSYPYICEIHPGMKGTVVVE